MPFPGQSLYAWRAGALQSGEITGSFLRKGICLSRGVGESVTRVFRRFSNILLPSKPCSTQCFLSFEGLTG